MKATTNLPLCLVLGNYVYGIATPLKIPPPINIPIIMEQNDGKVFWKKLKSIKLGQVSLDVTLNITAEKCITYLFHNSINTILLLNTNRNSQQVTMAIIIDLNQNNHPKSQKIYMSSSTQLSQLMNFGLPLTVPIIQQSSIIFYY